MEHITQDILIPAKEALHHLISPPWLSEHSESETPRRRRPVQTRMQLQEKEEELQRLQSMLNARSSDLQKREEALSERMDAGRIFALAPDSIAPNPHQPRREFEDLSLFSLANSIKDHGILQPLTVRRIASGDADETGGKPYQLIAGERRLRAAISIGMTAVPCIILEADNRRAAELALIENLQRENLNLFEQASAIAALIDMHAMTQEEIARALSLSQSCIANKLRVLRLTTEERELILAHQMTERHARAFLRIRDLDLRRAAVRYTADCGLNVAKTEQYVDSLLTGTTTAPIRQKADIPAPTQTNQIRKCILRDLRFFFNTLDRAVAALREAGCTASYSTDEQGETVTVTVTVSHADRSHPPVPPPKIMS